ncbi:MAG: glycosyltransferase family 9 protein [Candidatus Hydrogenedentes bacterium]|nr:glycosyltransferase family 9 protein [Candidatus Hydrogenedentota bacterium]
MIVQRSSSKTRTLVIHTGGIGDFLLFCPCLKRLAEEGPVSLAGADRDRLNLAVVCGIAEDAYLLDDIEFGSIFSTPTSRFEKFVAQFDRVVVWMTDDGGQIRRALLSAGVSDVRVYAGLPPKDWQLHAGAYYSESLGYKVLPPLVLPFEDDGFAHDAVIHAGSGSGRKNWPIENFVAVADALEARGRNVEWILGPAEAGLEVPHAARVIEVVSVVTLARHLAGTALYIGNDSGVTHLAAACGCWTVAIFSVTEPEVWAPRGERVSVVCGEAWPAVNQVIAAVDRT